MGVVAMMLVGCGGDDGEQASRGPAPGTAWITSILPSAKELKETLGGYYRDGAEPPPLGGTDALRAVRNPDKVSERQCLGVVDPLTSIAFGSAPVAAVTYAMNSAATYGVVALQSARDAQALFAKFTEQWRQCDGTTVVDRSGRTSTFRISEVAITDDVASASTVTQDLTGIAVPYLRALGVSQDCIVEVSAPATAASSADQAAVRLTRLMMDKVANAKR